jgi:ParB family chromosome partitioning protein
MNEAELVELTASIEASGLLQPVVVRPRNGKYELIAGERRWRAVQRLGWPKIPAVVKEVDDPTLLTLALIENLQRDNLSAMDEAAGYLRLSEEFQLPHAEIARMVGRDRSTIANLLRLLKLPEQVKQLVHQSKLTEGHARALLAISDQEQLVRMALEAVKEDWSVRELEARVRPPAPQRGDSESPVPRNRSKSTPQTTDVRRIEDSLRKRLGTDVRVTTRRKGRGFISISYYSNDDLARVLELILGEPFAG